jgi:DNA-binding response OmpR family regulator
MPDSDLQRNINGSSSPPTLVMAGAPLTARDEERRQWYVDTLEHAGYQVVSARDVSPAESAGGLPSMIIAHLFDPIADGIALCRKLRTAASTRDLPVIVVTRLDDPYTREQIVRSGASSILTEPLSRALLLRQVRRLMALAKAHAVAVAAD